MITNAEGKQRIVVNQVKATTVTLVNEARAAA